MVIVSLTVTHVSFAEADNKNVKALVADDDTWSNAAVAKDVDRVASFYAADGIAFPPDEPIAIGSSSG